MKKILNLSLVVLSLTLYSCFSNTCELSGCDKEGKGWENSRTEPSCAAWGACKPASSGGYCSKSHALKDY
jgi:hypothetical protein|tara:strand:+ start:342 stop:551 length:210 start_codon:yes stop_codon:yes gene_type:complete